jgi:Asp-tRNA(Asn)/Glu-tRNA(Gln) amidotransferase A subunit family amidase
MTYDLKPVNLPRLTGSALKALTAALENPLGQALLMEQLLRDSGILAFRQRVFPEPPTPQPLYAPGGTVDGPIPDLDALSHGNSQSGGFVFPSIGDYAAAYRNGQVTPLSVAEGLLQAVKASDATTPPLRAIIACQEDDVLAQARQSAERHAAGRPLSPLDGVPIAVKDELDQKPYPTMVGTRFLGQMPATANATVVARLRAAGALLFGKANMHEIGIGVTGLNPHHGTPRNPYNPEHFTGGSSSGPAAAVAAGLCPASLGADGGGSIRIPAGLCGIVGLKATFGRVSEAGAYPLCWSVAHVGPLAASARDAALLYAVIAGVDPLDPNTHNQPTPSLPDFEKDDLRGFKIGIYTPWFEHATAEVVSACHAMLDKLIAQGARIVEVEIPDLEAIRVAHLITIGSEMSASLDRYYADRHKDYGQDVRINLALSHSFTARDYIHARCMRTRAIANFRQALATCDVIVTPTTAITAPPIRPDALDGESDLTTLSELMRFAVAANLTGLPAISFPVGYDSQGLPVGMQAIGHPWAEHTLLRLARIAETKLARKKPALYFDVWRN